MIALKYNDFLKSKQNKKRAWISYAHHSMQTPRHRITKRKLNKAVIQTNKTGSKGRRRKGQIWELIEYKNPKAKWSSNRWSTGNTLVTQMNQWWVKQKHRRADWTNETQVFQQVRQRQQVESNTRIYNLENKKKTGHCWTNNLNHDSHKLQQHLNYNLDI